MQNLELTQKFSKILSEHMLLETSLISTLNLT